MATSNTDLPGTIYRWIEKKPLTEAVSWTAREKFWLMTAACHFGIHDWKSVAQVLKNAGEPYRPPEWYTPKSCERQFKTIISNLNKEVKSLPLIDLLKYVAEDLKKDYVRDAKKSNDALKSRYFNLLSIFNRVKQGNLSRNEVVSLYSQAKRNEIEGKQYMDQLMTRQNASLASENSSSGSSEEPIKWNTPSAPLLTSLLRSRNTIPANRGATTIASLLQSPGGTSRTRSGKLLPLTPGIRTTQGTPTLSKLLEAPANPYIQSPPQSTQKNKLCEVGTEKLANTSRKENSQSTLLNRGQVDNISTLGSFNQINKSDLSASRRQITKSPVSAVKNESKENSNFVILLSDSDNDEDTKNTIQNTSLKNSFEDKNDTIISRLEPRATRSQTRAESGFKQLNDSQLSSDGKKERETLKLQSGGSQTNEILTIDVDDDDDDDVDIDQIDVEPLSSIPDNLPSTCKVTRASLQRLRLGPSHNEIMHNKLKNKVISNKMLEEISANFVLSSAQNMVSNDIISDIEFVKDAIMLRKESQPKPVPCNTLATYDGKPLKQNRIIEFKGTSIRCVDSRNDSKLLSLTNQPILVVNKIKIPINIKLSSEQINKTDVQIPNMGTNKPIRLLDSSQNVVQIFDSNSSVTEDEVIVIDDDNDDNRTNELLSKAESQNLPSTIVSSNVINNSKSTVLQLDETKTKNDKTSWNIFGKTQNILHTTRKQCHQDSVSKIGINSNINETNRFVKELDFDFDQSISETSLSELYNGVEEIVEMHSFDNEELNSLIECSSLDSNETEERGDIICVDQGDSSVSESDSTIGAFDTFAQITRVQPKSFTSKGKKLDTRKLKTTNQGVKDLKHNERLCQSEEIDDDQSSAVSVTGIPILQGVISDVMSKIDLDRVTALKTAIPHNLPITDFVEISSDEEVTVNNLKTHHLTVNQNLTQEYKKENGLKKIQELETNIIKDAHNKHGTSTIKPSSTEITHNVLNVKNCTFNVSTKTNNNILEMELLQSKKEMEQKAKKREVEMFAASKADNVLKEVEEKKVKEITIKIANEKLIKEVERKKKEYAERIKKENEERIKKQEEEIKKKQEEEIKKKQEEEIKKKQQEEEIKKKQDEERKKKIIEEKIKKETEEKEKIERLEKEKKELEKRKKIEEDLKKKEDEERKTKEYEERMKKIEDEERKNVENDKYLNALKMALESDMAININNHKKDKVVVKEEVINEDDEEYGLIVGNTMVNNYKIKIKEEIITEEDILAEGLTEECYTEESITEECITNESFAGEGFIGECITEVDGTEDDGTEEDSTEEDSTEYDSTDDDSTGEDITEKNSTEEGCTVEHLYKATAISDPLGNMTAGDFVAKAIKVETISDEEINDDLINNDEYINESKSEAVFENCKMVKISDCKLQSFSDSISKQIESKKSKRIEGMMNNKKTNTARVVQRGYPELKKQSILLQAEGTQLKFVEARKRRIEEIESKKPKSIELKTEQRTKLNKTVELQNVGDIELRKTEEAVLKIASDLELRKYIEKGKEPKIILEKFDIGGLDKRNTLKKINEQPGYNRSVGHTEIDKVNSYNVSPAHCKKKNEHMQNDRNIEQVLIESRKTKQNVDLETLNPREREIRKSIGSERKISKEVETKLAEDKIITRTRKLKVDKKLKEQNVSSKLRPQIKFSGSSSPCTSLTFVGNSPIASFESKKQTKSTDDGNKRNNTSNTLYNNKRNLIVHHCVNVTKENLNHKSSNVPTTRTRTRSASFKQRAILETRSSKKIQGDSAAVAPKEMSATKPLVSAKCPNVQANKSSMPQNNIFDKPPEFNDHKQLLVPIVMLHKIHLRTLKFMKHHQPTCTQHHEHKPIETPPPKKRGRKRRIDVLHEKLPESSSNKPTLRNEKTMNTSIIEVEPLAKRTRRSLELRERKKPSVNKESVQPQKNKKDLVPKKSVQPQKNKKKLLNKSRVVKMNKNVMKFVCRQLFERNKYLLTSEKRLKNITPEQHPVIKTPVKLGDIKKKIADGQLINLDQLQIELLMLSNNALMINKCSTLGYSHITSFLSGFINDCQAFQNSIRGSDDGNSQHEYRTVNCGSNLNIVSSDVSEYTHDIIINKKSLANLHKTHKNSSKESYRKPQLKNKRKKNTSGSSHSGSDNC